jgi:hypothetical protein
MGAPGRRGEHGHASFEPHVSIRDSAEQGFYEFIHVLAGLAR